jgi:hypothetical protein
VNQCAWCKASDPRCVWEQARVWVCHDCYDAVNTAYAEHVEPVIAKRKGLANADSTA